MLLLLMRFLRDYESCFFFLFATLHLTCACLEQQSNNITSLKGAVFPAGLTTIDLVSFHHCRLLFCGVCVCDVRGAFGADVA